MSQQKNFLHNECSVKPKLRTFLQFKNFDVFPSYVVKPLSFIQRKFMAKLRLGCLQIRIETGRYSRPRLEENMRVCQVCTNQPHGAPPVENEKHFILHCPAYRQLRSK